MLDFVADKALDQGEWQDHQQREERVAGFTNLPPKKATAKRLLDVPQKPWHIEKRLPARPDVTRGEDGAPGPLQGAPQALAA